MIIEIMEGHHFPEPFETKNGVKYNQKGYINLGGAFPAEFIFRVDNPRGYPIGKYEMGAGSYRIAMNYGRSELQINPFELELIPLPAAGAPGKPSPVPQQKAS